MKKYIGIPFVDKAHSLDGADCYGLVRLIYRNELNIRIPEFNGSAFDTKKIFWEYLRQISECWERVDEPEKYSVVAMAHDSDKPKIVQHFGIYLGDGLLLHTLEKIGSHIVKIDEMKYYIKGFYRWKKHI